MFQFRGTQPKHLFAHVENDAVAVASVRRGEPRLLLPGPRVPLDVVNLPAIVEAHDIPGAARGRPRGRVGEHRRIDRAGVEAQDTPVRAAEREQGDGPVRVPGGEDGVGAAALGRPGDVDLVHAGDKIDGVVRATR